MSDPSPREWRFYIDDMISFAEKGALRHEVAHATRDLHVQAAPQR